MTITLYQTKSDKKRASKDLTLLVTLDNARLYDTFDVLHPRLKVSRETFDSIKSCNYAYIPDFGRYYFVKYEIDSNFVLLNCEVDVRTSYKEGIRGLTCTVTRNENLKNGYLHDSNYNVYAYEQVVCKMFPNAINQDSIILMTVG